jgi:transcriptional regulator with XRE-family HTH domain
MDEKFTEERVKDIRKQAGLSQWHIAKAIGRTQGWLSNIELGYVTPQGDELLKIVAVIRTLQQEVSEAN